VSVFLLPWAADCSSGCWRLPSARRSPRWSAAFVVAVGRVDAEVEIPIRDHVAEIRVARREREPQCRTHGW